MKFLSAVRQQLPAGQGYVLAVSGGVDSMVLLDVVRRLPGVHIVVAHVDHGIRVDSGNDYATVQAACRQYGLPFYGCRVRLGSQASEALARQVRWDFLKSVQRRVKAVAIVTAHHQDDLIETLVLQLQRGTYRRGLSVMTQPDVLRPFLNMRKQDIVEYAQRHHITWQEDSTNQSSDYARNRLRLSGLHTASNQTARQQLLLIHDRMSRVNKEADAAVQELLGWAVIDNTIVRWRFNYLPHDIAREVLAEWLRLQAIECNGKTLNLLTSRLKVQKPNTYLPIGGNFTLEIGKKTAKLLIQ